VLRLWFRFVEDGGGEGGIPGEASGVPPRLRVAGGQDRRGGTDAFQRSRVGFEFCTDWCECRTIVFLHGSIQTRSVCFLFIFYKPDSHPKPDGSNFPPDSISLWIRFLVPNLTDCHPYFYSSFSQNSWAPAW
jgi:hypothetical protein